MTEDRKTKDVGCESQGLVSISEDVLGDLFVLAARENFMAAQVLGELVGVGSTIRDRLSEDEYVIEGFKSIKPRYGRLNGKKRMLGYQPRKLTQECHHGS